MIPMSGKSEYLYNCIFNDVKNIIKDYGYDITNITKNNMVDFEKPLQTAIKKIFMQQLLMDVFFIMSNYYLLNLKNLDYSKFKN